jgi:hypothetical protein
VPEDTPVTTPVPLITVATAVLPLAQVPPVVPSVNVIVEPAQNAVEEEIADGVVLTVIIVVTAHPVPSEYVIIDVPDKTPVTTPVLLTTVATVVVPLDQVPPLVPSVNVIVEAEQNAVEVEIVAGSGFTVTILVALHPVLSV